MRDAQDPHPVPAQGALGSNFLSLVQSRLSLLLEKVGNAVFGVIFLLFFHWGVKAHQELLQGLGFL